MNGVPGVTVAVVGDVMTVEVGGGGGGGGVVPLETVTDTLPDVFTFPRMSYAFAVREYVPLVRVVVFHATSNEEFGPSVSEAMRVPPL